MFNILVVDHWLHSKNRHGLVKILEKFDFLFHIC